MCIIFDLLVFFLIFFVQKFDIFFSEAYLIFMIDLNSLRLAYIFDTAHKNQEYQGHFCIFRYD